MIDLRKLFGIKKKKSPKELIKSRFGTDSWNYRLWKFRLDRDEKIKQAKERDNKHASIY